MTDQVAIQAPKTQWLEGSAFTATAYFRTRPTSAVTPTNVQYRIDCLRTKTVLADWTSVDPGESVSISITPTHNGIQDGCSRYERKQLTVAADKGLSTEHKGVFVWRVKNLQGSL